MSQFLYLTRIYVVYDTCGIESRIVGRGSSLSHVFNQYARLMTPYKVETCYIAPVVRSCEDLFVKAQKWKKNMNKLSSIIYIL